MSSKVVASLLQALGVRGTIFWVLGLAFTPVPLLSAQGALPSPAPPSAPEAGRTVITVKSQLVLLDVSVLDSHGKPVTDLKASDFTVKEDKQQQTIRNFEPPSIHRRPSGEDGAPAPVVHSSLDLPHIGTAPVTLIVLDEQNTSFEDEVYAREQVIKWLRTQPPVLKQATILTALTYKDFRVLLDTTQDRDRMLDVLQRHMAAVPWRKENIGTVSGAASDFMASTLGALEQIAGSMRGVPGRKIVLWVGDGFPSVRPVDIGSDASKQVFSELRRVDEELYRSRTTLDVVGPVVKAPDHPTSMETLSEVLVNIVQFSTLDPEGSIAFANLAAPSGGTAYTGRNDLSAVMEEAETNGETYYTLTYTPTNSSDRSQRYRNISVIVNRPGVQVHTRDGYFPEPAEVAPVPPSKTAKQELAFAFYGAANSRLPYTDLHVAPRRADASHWVVAVRASDLMWTAGDGDKRQADEVVLAVCFDKNGRLLSRTFHDVGSNTAATDVQMLGRQVFLDFAMTAPPQTARVRFVVRDSGNGRVGAADAAP